ncbi:unnamed protein product [Protopolystoma xenopodis]|uniref:DNA mismatch repair proteins mutS family domain-containing protein n=1 Tax=Protopolystoma xenopodis TaxID=117903 RepID=A0A3S5C209_9PLAT|nr:unnamed protein product [Protopolystoma xenopodis]
MKFFSQPFIEIVEGLHPCLKSTFSGGDVIPNSIRLGYVPDLKDDFIEDGMESFRRGATTLLVTGPNMGGKSTLMRQTALLIILAHLVR